MTASCMTCIYSQLTKEQYPCSECYYDNNGNPSKHEPVVEALDINVGNMDITTHDSIPAETGKNDEDRTSGDCISRQAAIDEAEKWFFNLKDKRTVGEVLKNLPSIQPKHKVGRWMPCPQNVSWLYVYKCSECGGYLQISDVDGTGITAKYCSYCGAKMEGGEQE